VLFDDANCGFSDFLAFGLLSPDRRCIERRVWRVMYKIAQLFQLVRYCFSFFCVWVYVLGCLFIHFSFNIYWLGFGSFSLLFSFWDCFWYYLFFFYILVVFFFLVKCLCPLLNCSTRHLARAEWNVRSSWNRFSNWDWIDARTGLSEPTTKQVHTHTSALAAPSPPHHHLIRHHARAAPEVKCSKHDFALSLSLCVALFLFFECGCFSLDTFIPFKGGYIILGTSLHLW